MGSDAQRTDGVAPQEFAASNSSHSAITCPPMGAAFPEPAPPPSTITATAMAGVAPPCAGAQPMNHECGASPPDRCAVPVLPAVETPLTPYLETGPQPAWHTPSGPCAAWTL